MPPFVSRKRAHSPDTSPPSKRQTTSKPTAKRPKQSLFEAIDTPNRPVKSTEETNKYLQSLDDDDENGSSLSDVDSDEFEDVPAAKKQKTEESVKDEEEGDNGDEDEEMDWEDAIGQGPSNASHTTGQEDTEIGDVSISLKEDGSYVEEPLVSFATGKKGPSKKERQARFLTHCLHVQSLMWHNTVRNSWLNDKEVQRTLVDSMPEGVKREVTRWREAMGTLTKEELDAKKKQAAAKNKGKRGSKGKGKASGRDWNYDAQHSEQGVPNLSAGDPLLRLLKVLTSYWRKKFTVAAPAFRKLGYMPLKRLREEIKDWQNDRNNADDHGERIENLAEFRELAKNCEGSRDVGAQLFAALLRGIGIETRMVANLQPAGIGWSKGEEANPKKPKKEQKAEKAAEEPMPEEPKSSAKRGSREKPSKKLKDEKPSRKSSRGNKAEPISLDDSDSPLSDPPSEAEAEAEEGSDDDDLSVVDITPATPRKKPTKKYDRDLAFPTYWTEVCSPATHKYIPVDPIVLSTIASNEELLQTFEPRGKKAEYAKQVICYTVAFSPDGTAKDVTVRYLKKHQLPGKTKGMRMPAEKIPIYNKRGKVKKYEEYDWFRTVMSLYDRPEAKRTAADDLEEQTELKPFKPAKEEKEVEKESLQWYKQSAEFVLEQHLRREEAIIPGAEPVKMFTAGKGDKAKEHPVYRRDDVATCKTVESWHKEGRAVKVGEQPMKHVPMRAVTLVRKREMEEAFRETGEKLTQGLYSWDQTDWIIPPPIENGVIPKNAFGNMDVYVETMVPKGAVHLPLKGTAKICRKLEIDYAEACTGFEFGKQRAVPVLTGVVVAEEHAKMVKDAWRAEQKEIKRKEDTKRTTAALHWWRKMLMGMRIVERMRAEYANTGRSEEEINPFASKAEREGREPVQPAEEVGAGGFFAPGHDEEEVPQNRKKDSDAHMGGGFVTEEDDEHMEGGDEGLGDEPEGGGFLIEDDLGEEKAASQKDTAKHAPVTPVSLQSMHQPPGQFSDGEDEQDDEDEEQEEPKPPVQRKRAFVPKAPKTKPAAKPKTKPRGKSKKPTPKPSSNDASESPLSELEDEPSEEESRSEKAPSPKVIVTPQNSKTVPTRRTRSVRSAAKSTPKRSQYFASADDDDDDDDESSEEEVVKPTRTTARTRKK